MNNMRYFLLILLAITFQAICDAKATPVQQNNQPYKPMFYQGPPLLLNSGFDSRFNDGFNNRATSIRTQSSIFNNDFPRTGSLFDPNPNFPSANNFPQTMFFGTNSAFPRPAMPSFPSDLNTRPFTYSHSSFGSFPSNPSSSHSSDSDESSDTSDSVTSETVPVIRTQGKKSRKVTTHTSTTLIISSFASPHPTSNLPPYPKPIAKPPVANHDHSDESSSDDKSKKPPHSLQNAAAVATAAAAGATVGSALTNKPPPTQIRPPVAAEPNSANAQQPENDKGRCNWCLRKNCNPGGCQEVANFDAKKDAEALHNAIKSKPANERLVIDILTHRSDKQIKRIKEEYQEYLTSLKTDIEKSNLKSKELLEALLLPRHVFFAKELQKAFKKNAGDYEAMIVMLTSLSPCAIKKIGVAYREEHGETLAQAIKDASSRNFEDFLVKLSKGSRKPDGPVDEAAANQDAKALADARSNRKFGKVFIDIFTDKSYSQLREIIKKYNEMSKSRNSNIEKDVKSNTSDELQAGLLAMIHNVQDQPGYFANELEGSLEALLGNSVANKDMLIRIMRGRCGIDLGDIRNAYPKNHDGKKLVDKIATKNDIGYKEVLEAMLKDSNADSKADSKADSNADSSAEADPNYQTLMRKAAIGQRL